MADNRVGPNPNPNLYNEEEGRQYNYPSPPTQGNEAEMEKEEQGEWNTIKQSLREFNPTGNGEAEKG